jgi:hypothetical protein
MTEPLGHLKDAMPPPVVVNSIATVDLDHIRAMQLGTHERHSPRPSGSPVRPENMAISTWPIDTSTITSRDHLRT